MFLFVHVPFGGSGCAYCNLFTASTAASNSTRCTGIADAVRAAIPDAALHRSAAGGDTPVSLDETSSTGVFDLAEMVTRMPHVTNAAARTNLP